MYKLLCVLFRINASPYNISYLSLLYFIGHYCVLFYDMLQTDKSLMVRNDTTCEIKLHLEKRSDRNDSTY